MKDLSLIVIETTDDVFNFSVFLPEEFYKIYNLINSQHAILYVTIDGEKTAQFPSKFEIEKIWRNDYGR